MRCGGFKFSAVSLQREDMFGDEARVRRSFGEERIALEISRILIFLEYFDCERSEKVSRVMRKLLKSR